jgi:CheY-like chemotaxis protein
MPDSNRISKDFEILVVDDDAELRESVAMLLSELGYQVKTAAAAGPALALLGETGHRIAVLLTDILMPGGMNGFELANQAKALLPDLCVIYTTGYPSDALPEAGALHGKLLMKPWELGELLGEIERCVHR